MLKISKKFHQGAQTIIISLVIFAGVALKCENIDSTFSSFNSFPSLPLVATDERKWFQCLLNQTVPLFLNSIDAKEVLVF